MFHSSVYMSILQQINCEEFIIIAERIAGVKWYT